MREAAHTLTNLHRSPTAQGFNEWYLPTTKLFKARQHLVALLIAGTTADSPEPSKASKQATGAELESFLKELAAELHITPEAAEQIWKDYHPEQKATHDELQEPGDLSRLDRSVSV